MASMRFTDLLAKKRDGFPLTSDEIAFFVKGILQGEVQDVQLGAMLMAMYLKGLNFAETTALTKSMLQSGGTFQWPDAWRSSTVDKHSTGGVGDKVSLILAPALAACGLKVPMISGRSLGFTGGTIDKLESIPGFRALLTEAEAFATLEKVGCFIMAQTGDIVPADKILYASRDVTATVDNISLITASILSKKAAENLSALVLDIKCGRAAFCRDYTCAKALADLMFKVGNELGLRTAVTITRMDHPLGRMIGNALEVRESVELLKGHGPSDLKDLIELQGGILLALTKTSLSIEEGKQRIAAVLENGSALKKFEEMLKAQGVEPNVVKNLCRHPNETVLPKSLFITDIIYDENEGYVADIDALELAKISSEMGAGRFKSGDKIKFAVGLELLIQPGSYIEKNQVWVRVHHDHSQFSESHRKRLQASIKITTLELYSKFSSTQPQVIEIIY